MLGWEQVHGRRFDQLFDDEVRSFQPDLLFTYGGSPGDLRRRQRARRQGARVVFALHNTGYAMEGAFADVDGVLTPSRFLTGFYRSAIGLESTPLPLPVDPEDVVAQTSATRSSSPWSILRPRKVSCCWPGWPRN